MYATVSGDNVLPQSSCNGISGPKVMAWPISASAAVTGRRNLGFPVSAIRALFPTKGGVAKARSQRCQTAEQPCFDFACPRPYQYRPFRTGRPAGANQSASKVYSVPAMSLPQTSTADADAMELLIRRPK